MSQLARIQNAGMPDASQMSTMLQMADALYKSGLLPTHIKSSQAAFAVIQKGTELGIPPMYALSNIVVIQGKPTANAELMAALIYRDHGDDALVFDSSNDACTVRYKRRGWSKAAAYSFTRNDAKTAGLNSETWGKYPAAMLRARCISAVARMSFPDSIGGLYTADELGAAVVVDADGSVSYDARETLPMPDAPRQIAEATVVDGNVVTDDGEIVGELQRRDDALTPNQQRVDLEYVKGLVDKADTAKALGEAWNVAYRLFGDDAEVLALFSARKLAIKAERKPAVEPEFAVQ